MPMNIFYLDSDVKKCAQMHNDRHCTKMILEYAQLLSTAHRVLDGKECVVISRGKKKKIWKLEDVRDSIVYSATHVNHPSAIWARDCASNYLRLYHLWLELMDEYTYRYGKIHACSKLIPYLKNPPNNILVGKFTEPTPAMPKEYIVDGDSIASYRNYYNGAKQHLAKWNGKLNNRGVPFWFKPQIV